MIKTEDGRHLKMSFRKIMSSNFYSFCWDSAYQPHKRTSSPRVSSRTLLSILVPLHIIFRISQYDVDVLGDQLDLSKVPRDRFPAILACIFKFLIWINMICDEILNFFASLGRLRSKVFEGSTIGSAILGSGDSRTQEVPLSMLCSGLFPAS